MVYGLHVAPIALPTLVDIIDNIVVLYYHIVVLCIPIRCANWWSHMYEICMKMKAMSQHLHSCCQHHEDMFIPIHA